MYKYKLMAIGALIVIVVGIGITMKIIIGSQSATIEKYEEQAKTKQITKDIWEGVVTKREAGYENRMQRVRDLGATMIAPEPELVKGAIYVF